MSNIIAWFLSRTREPEFGCVCVPVLGIGPTTRTTQGKRKKDSIEIGSIINRGPWVRTTVRIDTPCSVVLCGREKPSTLCKHGKEKKKKKEAMQGYEAFCCTEREVLVHWDSVCFVTWLYAESMTKIYASYATHMTCVSDPRRTFTASSHLSLFDSSFSVVRILCHRIALFVIPSWHTQPQYYSWHSWWWRWWKTSQLLLGFWLPSGWIYGTMHPPRIGNRRCGEIVWS